MSVSAISATGSSAAKALSGLAMPERTQLKQGLNSGSSKPSASDIKKAASQFEAIIIRQLLGPAIEPAMSGGMGGEKSAGGGGGVYGYMLTDALANSLSQGRGLGLASMLEKQFSNQPAAHPVTSSATLKLHSNSPSSP